MADLNSGWDEANKKIDGISTNNQVSQDIKQLKKNKGNSFERLIGDTSTQLNKIKEQQKRFQRDVPTSMDQLIGLISKTKGATELRVSNSTLSNPSNKPFQISQS
jgi:Tfp pilus assembly PilM family ATPase